MNELERCLALGATGLVGQTFMVEAASRFGEVVGAARQGADLTVDLCDATALCQILERQKPNLVVNVAALTTFDVCERDPSLAYLLNARAVAIMAEYCTREDILLLQISTDQFYTGDSYALHDEEAPVRLINEYARSKYAGEQHACVAPKSLVIRTNVTGWRRWKDRPTFIEWTIDLLNKGERITAFDDYFTSTIDSSSLARAAINLSLDGYRGLFNVACREVSSKKTFITQLAKKLGFGVTNIVEGSVGLLGTNRAESCGLAVSKAERALGYRLPDAGQVIDVLLAGAVP